MSIRQNFPTTQPSLVLDFANSKTLDPRITFARPSTSGDATYMDANGLIVTAAADEPRFDHKIENGVVKSLGLLVEEQRSNTLPYSEDFSQSDWATFGTASKSSNVATAPDGNFTADSITIPTSSGVYDNIAASASTTYTFSSYIRGTPGSTVRILLNFNSSGVTSKTVTVSDVWKRFDVTATSNASDSNVSVQYDQGNGNTFYVWGAQVEVGSFPTSYIPTSGSTKTRSPDSVSMTGTNFSDWYNQNEGTIYCSANNDVGLNTSTSTYFYAIDDTSNSSGDFIRQWVWSGNTGLLLHSVYTSNTTGQGSVISAEFSNTLTTDNKKTAVGYAKSDFASYYNGTSLNTDTSGNLPVGIDRLRIGTNLSGHISQLAYYPKRLTNTQLQNLTK